MLQIHPFTPDDYAAVVEIDNAVYQEYPGTVEELRYRDKSRDPKCKWQRWVAQRGRVIVGFALYDQHPGMYHPRKFWVNVIVHPDFQRQGIGSALYEHLIEALRPLDPILVRSSAREDMERSIQFLNARGFEEEMRAWESRLDVAGFDPTPFSGLDEKVRGLGIEIKTLKELESDSERDRKLHELEWELLQDVPQADPPTKVSFEHFIERQLENPNLLSEAWFVAIDNDEYIGMSNLWASKADDNELYTGLTGVKRTYRRKGIATAMKVRGIAYAKGRGHGVIKTWNESNNRPMLAINERLGYVKQPAWIDFVKPVGHEAAGMVDFKHVKPERI